jgi:hypothetical protein
LLPNLRDGALEQPRQPLLRSQRAAHSATWRPWARAAARCAAVGSASPRRGVVQATGP